MDFPDIPASNSYSWSALRPRTKSMIKCLALLILAGGIGGGFYALNQAYNFTHLTDIGAKVGTAAGIGVGSVLFLVGGAQLLRKKDRPARDPHLPRNVLAEEPGVALIKGIFHDLTDLQVDALSRSLKANQFFFMSNGKRHTVLVFATNSNSRIDVDQKKCLETDQSLKEALEACVSRQNANPGAFFQVLPVLEE